jgi:hypothetical protein
MPGVRSSIKGAVGQRNVETTNPPADYEVVARFRQMLGGVVAAFLPLLSGLALCWLNEWSPKTWVDPQCGLPDWVLIAYVPLAAVPPIFAAMRLRQAGKGWRLVVPVVCLALLVTAGACIIGFLVWFARHNCGE